MDRKQYANTYYWRALPRVHFESPEQASFYLAGMIDADGCVMNTRVRKCVTITNTRHDVIQASLSALELLGVFQYSVNVTEHPPESNRQTHYVLVVGAIAEIRKLRDLPLKHELKKQKLMGIDWEPSRHKITPAKRKQIAELRADGFTLRQIADELDVTHATICHWLHKAA